MELKTNNLSRKSKLLVVLTNDFLLALICWLVFGPPMATYIASEFSTGILDIFMREWLSFVYRLQPQLFILYVFGFYRTIIKFFDSKDSILISLIGSMIFGGSWAVFISINFKLFPQLFFPLQCCKAFFCLLYFMHF